jgi:hypothetical protein
MAFPINDAKVIMSVEEDNSFLPLLGGDHLQPRLRNLDVGEFKDLSPNIENDLDWGLHGCDKA